MPKVRLQKELENIKRESEAAFQIREEFVRWDNVKTAHDLVDDMEVARMLLDCYDLIGGNFLVWSDQAKLAPPPLHATLFLQHVSEEGWEVLQEIKALGGWRQDKDKDKTEPEQRKSKRKQARVRHIEPVQVKQEVVDPEDGEDRDSQDDDYVPSGDDDDDFVPEEEDIQPKRLTKMIRKPKSRPDRGKKATKKKVAQVEAQESDDDATEDEEKDEEEETSPQPAQRKRGRPKKREVRPPPPPRKSKKKKPKPEEQETPAPMESIRGNSTAPMESIGGSGTTPMESTSGYGTAPMESIIRRNGTFTRRIYQCKICSTGCKTRTEFRKHFKEHLEPKDKARKEINVAENSFLLHHCLKCDLFFTEESVKYHRKVHSYRNKDMDIMCDICGKLFKNKCVWRAHMKAHKAKESGKRFLCEVCNKEFVQMKDLKAHLQKHTYKRVITCEKCGKGFKTNSKLRRHMKVHSEVKPFTCKQCGKGFTLKYNLKGHQRMHTGEKPFKCDICNAAFTHNVSLKTHKRSAHGIDMWKDQKPQELQEIDHKIVADPNLFVQYEVQNVSKEEDDTVQSWIKENLNLSKESGGSQNCTGEIKAAKSSQNVSDKSEAAGSSQLLIDESIADGSEQHPSEERMESKDSGSLQNYSGKIEAAGRSQHLSEENKEDVTSQDVQTAREIINRDDSHASSFVTVPFRPLNVPPPPPPQRLHGEPNFQPNLDVAHHQPTVSNQEALFDYERSYKDCQRYKDFMNL
ncbi:uncharacterized protein [Amphiura filiformis]|uniref:uncharacterized protein isoform X4 n=1 Tax=Amphiura filiformis TaxID=82378 RepID=UPI003B2168F1